MTAAIKDCSLLSKNSQTSRQEKLIFQSGSENALHVTRSTTGTEDGRID